MHSNIATCSRKNEVEYAFMCHPERSVAESKSEHSEDRIVLCTIRDLLKAEWQIPFADPQNAMRFDFTKSAIYRRFCKVRLLKHPTGMFYPLRMTPKITSCSIIMYLLYPYQLRFANCSPILRRRRLLGLLLRI